MPRWPDRPEKRKLRVITCNLSEHQLELLETLRTKGIIPSRSEGIRLALNYGLPYLIRMIAKQEKLIQRSKTSKTPWIPSNTIFVEKGDGLFQKYIIVGEA